jgi:predicted RNA-binding protein with PUA-like domain
MSMIHYMGIEKSIPIIVLYMTQKNTNYWLMKSEPSDYSIDDLKSDKRASWDGVRNYQARNFMRDAMKVGDGVLFYHSGTDPGVVGVAEVCREAYPDHTAFDKRDVHFDPKSKKDNPTWYMVDVCFVKKFKEAIMLVQLKTDSQYNDMLVVKQGMRLSVQPVEKKHFDLINKHT